LPIDDKSRREYKAASRDEDGMNKARYDLLRTFLFKGLRGEVIKSTDIKPFIPLTHPRSKPVLLAQTVDALQDLFGLDVRQKYKRKAPSNSRSKSSSSSSSSSSSQGSKKKRRRKKHDSEEEEEEEEEDEEDNAPSCQVTGTHDYYVVNALAPAPVLKKSNNGSNYTFTAGQQRASELCDDHRGGVGGGASDVVHAKNALLMTTLALITQGEQDNDGRMFLDEQSLLDRIQQLFKMNISGCKRSNTSVHAKLGPVKELITNEFVKQDYLRKGLHPSNKKNDSGTAVLKVYWLGQHAVHDIGLHSLYEWMTKITGHPSDEKQWKEWARRDSDAKQYC
jgi:hypothetical protein